MPSVKARCCRPPLQLRVLYCPRAHGWRSACPLPLAAHTLGAPTLARQAPSPSQALTGRRCAVSETERGAHFGQALAAGVPRVFCGHAPLVHKGRAAPLYNIARVP